jgi:hypothetical protein
MSCFRWIGTAFVLFGLAVGPGCGGPETANVTEERPKPTQSNPSKAPRAPSEGERYDDFVLLEELPETLDSEEPQWSKSEEDVVEQKLRRIRQRTFNDEPATESGVVIGLGTGPADPSRYGLEGDDWGVSGMNMDSPLTSGP